MLFSLSSLSSCLPTLESDNFSFSSLLSLSLLSVLIYDTKAMCVCVCALVIIAQSLLASSFRRMAELPNTPTAPFLQNSFPLVAPGKRPLERSLAGLRRDLGAVVGNGESVFARQVRARVSVVAHSVLEFLLSCRKYYLREGQCTFVPFSFRLNTPLRHVVLLASICLASLCGACV